MSDFLEREASESEDSEAEALNKKRKKVIISDDEDSSQEEEEDDEAIAEEVKDFIDDNPEEEEGSGEDDDDGEGKRKYESDMDEDLSDEDYNLIEENLGKKIKRKKKRKRIKIVASDDEDSGGEKEKEPEDERDVIAHELFEGDEGPREEEEEEAPPPPVDYDDSFEDESDPDDFIVDEENRPISKGRKKKKARMHGTVAHQDALEIFGVDFQFDEFDQYGDDYDMEGSEDEEYDEEEEEIGEDGEPTGRRKTSKKTSKRKGKKKTIYDVFEPSELEQGHFTDLDKEIRLADMPERFQLRGIPVCPPEEKELPEEAEWIFKQAFQTQPISNQEVGEKEGTANFNKRGPDTVKKIEAALKFMRDQQFEVPFIAFYRKEYVEPELNINDLWKVYQWDEKWMQLKNRKENLVRLFEKMQTFQFEQIDPDAPLESHFRALTNEDVQRARSVQSLEELKDVYQHFLLYYGADIPKMKNAEKKKKKQNKERGGGDGEEEHEEIEEEEQPEMLKQATRKSGYSMCQQAGLADLASKFGLTPEQFGENLRDNYTRHDVAQDPALPLELAAEFVKGAFQSPEDALQGARHMVAMQIAHDPVVRECIRQTYYERAKVSCRPTKKGFKLITEDHQCYTFKYLKDKPVKDFKGEQFLKLQQAVDDGLIEYEIHIDAKDAVVGGGTAHAPQTYYEEIQQLFQIDEFSNLVQLWNAQRSQALERALTKILYPQMAGELKNKLLAEAKDCVLKACCRKLHNWLKVAPYQADQQLDDDEDYLDSSKGLRVMGVSVAQDRDEASFCVMIDGDGEVTDYLRLVHIKKRLKSWREHEREEKQNDLDKLKEFISTKKPHVIAVGAESRDILTIVDDIKNVVAELEAEQQMGTINVELVDTELATVFMNSNKAEQEFREYPGHLRIAISLARKIQDPLVEFCQLCNTDEDILCLKYHPLQDALPKEELMNALSLEFVNRVNEVGVDVNHCCTHGHTGPLVQFICGLGPRKGNHLLKVLKMKNTRLENRTQLVTTCQMGPKVFINCAGFIKIDTNSLGDSTDSYVEVLDGSRVHPETYEWARKMAVDALEYDDTAEDANPAGALEEILESPERLRDLDLDAFAEELERQGYGNKHITLYDIRAELNHRYKDLRTPYRSPSAEEKFDMLTKETPYTFYIGKLVMCRVTGIAHKRPRDDQLDQANPVRDEETALWSCPFCKKNDFPELSEVWNHFDAQECPGEAMGVKTRLDNGVMGFIHVRNLSDKKVTNPEERVKVNMTIHARITKLDIENFKVELTSKTSDLIDEKRKWKLPKDEYYDDEAESKETKKEDDKKKQKARQTYVKRVIVHPSFHNIDYKNCERLMATMDQGDVIIRPSSKGSDHLTCTWKVTDGIMDHIDIREEGKENAFSLGSSLLINNEEFEDLDEIIARHVQPLAAFARDILNYKYYRDTDGGKREILDKLLIEEKKKAPSKIPYYFTASKQYPGKFLLSYLPKKNTKHEFVTVTPEGLRYRGQMFHSLNSLIKWFKEHFRDPIPGTPASSIRTPVGMSSHHGNTPRIGVDQAAIQRAAAGLPNSVFNTLSQVAGTTPANYPGGNFMQRINTPMMTPMMTPSHGPSALATPGGPMATPVHRITTPAYQPMATPSQQQAMATPSYTPTPRAWPGATPGRTPSQQPQRTPQRTPQSRTPTQGKSRSHSAAVDWAKEAEKWAKKNKESGGGKKKTPRTGQSPATSDMGGATPLFDER